MDIEKRPSMDTPETSFDAFKRVFDERDAALRDLQLVHDGKDHTPCETCLYGDGGEPDGPDCENCCNPESLWVWRGIGDRLDG